MLDDSGGIQCDLTVCRVADRRVLHRHRHRLRHARLRLDPTIDPGRRRTRSCSTSRRPTRVLSLMGPTSRDDPAGGHPRRRVERGVPVRHAADHRHRRLPGARAARHVRRRARVGAAPAGRVRHDGLRRADGRRRTGTAWSTPATGRSRAAAWRRAIGRGAATSAPTTRRSRPGSAGR